MKIGRNDPCPCGSGKKYKQCCLKRMNRSEYDMIREAVTENQSSDKIADLLCNLYRYMNEKKNDSEVKEIEALSKLPVTIFVTSTMPKLKGFKTYRLKSIGRNAASLIFRDNYGSCLSKEDKIALDQIVSKEEWCNPINLRQFAQTAKQKGWSVQKLKERLDMK